MAGDHDFEHGSSFEQGELGGGVRIDRFEAHYEQLFSEVIQDGVITSDERARLDEAAQSLGLDGGRLRQLERALEAAYQARHRVIVREADPDEERASLRPIEPANDPRTRALERRIEFLERRVAELERELEDARAHVQVEVDLSDVSVAPGSESDVEDLQRRIRHDPRDTESLRALFRAVSGQGDVDRSYCVAKALVFLGSANDQERSVYRDHHDPALMRPRSSLSNEAFRRLLFHPDEELLTSEIFAVIVPAVLLGRVAALRHAKALPHLDPAKRLDPRTSTVQAVRCFSWAASILGLGTPPFYADPSLRGFVEMVPGVPPASRIGKASLSGRSPQELAFVAGRHLAGYREENFVRLLLPSIPDLEDLFLAALSIGNPGLPLHADMKRRVVPIAKAIEPILEPVQIDRLRGHFLRFVEQGGRTNLQRWAIAADRTSLRAGFLLCGDLDAAQTVLRLDAQDGGAPGNQVDEEMDDLLVFLTSERYAKLRRQLGIAVG
jgi:hypothetical protein